MLFQFGPVSLGEKLSTAFDEAFDIYQQAMGGNLDALGESDDAIQQLLSILTQAYAPGTAQYQAFYDQIQEWLADLLDFDLDLGSGTSVTPSGPSTQETIRLAVDNTTAAIDHQTDVLSMQLQAIEQQLAARPAFTRGPSGPPSTRGRRF
jgi:hypothetical protein